MLEKEEEQTQMEGYNPQGLINMNLLGNVGGQILPAIYRIELLPLELHGEIISQAVRKVFGTVAASR